MLQKRKISLPFFGWGRVNFLHSSWHGTVVWICAIKPTKLVLSQPTGFLTFPILYLSCHGGSE